MPPPRSELRGPEPRDLTLDPISAPLVTSYSLKALIDSPQFQQSIILPSGRTVSYATCGSRTGTPVLYFYGLGGSSRQIASMHAQAVRLDIKLLSVDRPGTGFTDPFKAPSTSRRRKQDKTVKGGAGAKGTAVAGVEGEEEGDHQGDYEGHDVAFVDSEDEHNGEHERHSADSKNKNSSKKKSSSMRGSFDKGRRKKTPTTRAINPRVHHSCLEALAVLDTLLPGARFGLTGHSCGIYYIMHMIDLFGPAGRIQRGPICLLTPWVPFNECPETTSKTFKFLKHVPRGLVWAVTSSMNHLGSVILSSSNALSGTLSNKNLNGSCVEELESSSKSRRKSTSSRKSQDRRKSRDGSESGSGTGSQKDTETIKKPADPFIVQFSDAFDKVVLPALVHDMNRQHSNGYNSEIQMCVSDVGFDLADVSLPAGVTINAYCGHLDNIVPIEAAREMGKKCAWEIHEFQHSGHGGPRMSMYALEDYALAIQSIESAKAVEEQWNEKQ